MAAQPATATLDEAATVRQPGPADDAPVLVGERERLAAAFRDLGHGENGESAFERTKHWCRASGAEWAHSLS